jgi:hypothetical protein
MKKYDKGILISWDVIFEEVSNAHTKAINKN